MRNRFCYNLTGGRGWGGEGRKEEKGKRSEEGGEGEEGEGEGGNKIQICYIIVQYLKMFVIFVQ